MPMRLLLIAIAVLAVLPVGAASDARAQGGTRAARPHASARTGKRPRIEVNPGRLLYRRCEVQYVLQHRPSGTVLYPEQYCWWVRG
jgi:hypothetical protein